VNFSIWGLSGSLHTRNTPTSKAFAEDRLNFWLDVHRPGVQPVPRRDSELHRLNDAAGTCVLQRRLVRALVAARRASELTGVLCDPTVPDVARSIGATTATTTPSGDVRGHPRGPCTPAGFAALGSTRRRAPCTRHPCGASTWRASAKALVADLVADDVAPTGGVLVEIGGDVSARGRGSEGPWVIGISPTLTNHRNGTAHHPGERRHPPPHRTTCATCGTRGTQTIGPHHRSSHRSQCREPPSRPPAVIDADCVGANAFAHRRPALG